MFETPEQIQLREAVSTMARRYGHPYFVAKAKSGGTPTSCGPRRESSATSASTSPPSTAAAAADYRAHHRLRELAAAGCPLLLLVVSPAIAGTILTKHGTEEQRQTYLPGIADGSHKIVFAITEPDAARTSHRLATTASADGDDWVLNGRKCFISGVDEAQYILVVARTEDAATGRLIPALFVVPVDAPG
jgi:alkylation response protein AidB-like acyl-CoA dehydrogenase